LDVSDLGVCNLVGNVREFTRSQGIGGKVVSVIKGGDAVSEGIIFGLAPHQMIMVGDLSHELIGFRCVIEQEAGPGN
jgi:hypothetical protein